MALQLHNFMSQAFSNCIYNIERILNGAIFIWFMFVWGDCICHLVHNGDCSLHSMLAIPVHCTSVAYNIMVHIAHHTNLPTILYKWRQHTVDVLILPSALIASVTHYSWHNIACYVLGCHALCSPCLFTFVSQYHLPSILTFVRFLKEMFFHIYM